MDETHSLLCDIVLIVGIPIMLITIMAKIMFSRDEF